MSRRRVLLVLACGLAGLTAGALGPPLSRAAEPAQKVVRLGYVHPASPSTIPPALNAFWERLRELGWVEGQNVVVERRWAEGHFNRLPALMAEIIESKVDVLVTYSTPAGIAAKKATSTIPIVNAAMYDPVRSGLVESLARPGGNLTGLSMGFDEGIGGKWLEFLQETVPRLSTIAVIANLDNPVERNLVEALKAVAPARRLKLRIIDVRAPEGFSRAFEQARKQAQAALVFTSPISMANRQQIAALAAKYKLPAMYGLREYVDAGGLMAYAPDLAVLSRRAADYVDKILKGANPADLPIEQPTEWELVVNLKTAKALGITIPESILLRADEVIR